MVPLDWIPLGIAAVVCGRQALRAIEDDPALDGRGRSWFGIVAGGLGAAAWAFLVAAAVIDEVSRLQH